MADVLERALDAARLASYADAAAMPDQLVGKVDPLLAWDDLHKVLLDLLRHLIAGEFKTPRETVDVGVDDDALRFLEPRTEDDVGGFAGNSGQGEELVHLLRDLAFEIFDDLARGADDRFRFVAEEAGAANIGL